MNILKKVLKSNRNIYRLSVFTYYLFRPLSTWNVFLRLFRYLKYFKQLLKYMAMEQSEKIRITNLRPCLDDWTKNTPVDSYYFYQDTWLAEKIFNSRPKQHVDVGSTALLVGILSKITNMISIDIRPLPVTLKNLEFKEGSILNMPFKNDEIFSLSSMCVIEHIGLGRYGDDLNPQGSQEAMNELTRVVGKNGNLYISVPLGEESVYFNAYRMFDVDKFVKGFKEFMLVDALIITPDKQITMNDYLKIAREEYADRMVVGCFHFKKR